MKNLKQTIATLTLTGIIIFGATAANAGIIVSSRTSDGIIVSSRTQQTQPTNTDETNRGIIVSSGVQMPHDSTENRNVGTIFVNSLLLKFGLVNSMTLDGMLMSD